MEQRLKYLMKLSSKEQKHIREIVTNITSHTWDTLDIRPLTGRKGWFRCRTGKMRIIFSVSADNIVRIEKLGSRGDIYKN